jgi:hypothetical protein
MDLIKAHYVYHNEIPLHNQHTVKKEREAKVRYSKRRK